MPRSRQSLVDMEKAARSTAERVEAPDTEFALHWLGVDLRPCIACDAFTDRPDRFCPVHDFDFGAPRWRDGSGVLDFRVSGRQEEIRARVDAWYRERGYGT